MVVSDKSIILATYTIFTISSHKYKLIKSIYWNSVWNTHYHQNSFLSVFHQQIWKKFHHLFGKRSNKECFLFETQVFNSSITWKIILPKVMWLLLSPIHIFWSTDLQRPVWKWMFSCRPRILTLGTFAMSN